MIIKSQNTIDAFKKAKKYLETLSDPIDTELSKESPILIIFSNLSRDKSLPDYNGKKFFPKINYQKLIHKNKDFSQFSFNHYENLLNNKIKLIIKYLIKNPLSKRAIIDVWSEEQQDLKNNAECIVYILFRQMNNSIDMHIHMRANDGDNKALLNFHTFASIHKYVAKKINLEVGKYYHYADSYHLRKESNF